MIFDDEFLCAYLQIALYKILKKRITFILETFSHIISSIIVIFNIML